MSGSAPLMSSRSTGGRLPPLAMARRFALTLVPIAIGYHVAHYLTFLLIQGQYIIPLLSDPFGFGWNLFGTAGYRVDIAVVGARFAWYAAVTAILVRAHRRGLSRPSRGVAALRRARRRVALASPAHRADGGLHLREPRPFSPSRWSSGAPPAPPRARPSSAFRKTRCCRSRQAAGCSRWAPARSPARSSIIA